MIQNNNLSVLPFYYRREYQYHRQTNSFGDFYKLITPINKLLPFQVIIPKTAGKPVKTELFAGDDTFIKDVSTVMNDAGLRVVESVDFNILIFSAYVALDLSVDPGKYYLKVTLTDGTLLFSEVFTLCVNVERTLRVEWWDDQNLFFDAGEIDYQAQPFHNILYFCTELSRPEYPFDEEGVNRDGYFFASKQISKKVYRCNLIVPEYLCDAMRLIRMSDHIIVRDQFNREYECTNFLITPKWLEQGNLANVEVEFSTANVVKKTGTGYTIAGFGDFNVDFNNDYLTKKVD